MIFSASRRTDIPAFFGEWMLNRFRSGELAVRNPMNPRQVTHFKFNASNIDCIVFWTKNPARFMKHLTEINDLGYKYYFQFTITGYENDVEKNLDKTKIISTFKKLSSLIGKEKVLWRYDPVLINEKYTISFHTQHFAEIYEQLHDFTEKCVLSFIDNYSFLNDSFLEFGIQELQNDKIDKIVQNFCDIRHKYPSTLQIATCCEGVNLEKYNIIHHKCVDDGLVARITGKKNVLKKDPSQRTECGCVISRDIGTYSTCQHDCIYCYARRGKKVDMPIDNDSLVLGENIDYNIDKIKIIDLRESKELLL